MFAGVLPSDPCDIEYTPAELYAMFEATLVQQWQQAGHLMAVTHNSAFGRKRKDMKRPDQMIPEAIREMIQRRNYGRKINAPGVPVSFAQMKEAILGGPPKQEARSAPQVTTRRSKRNDR